MQQVEERYMAHSAPTAQGSGEHAVFEVRGIEPVPTGHRYGRASSQFGIWFGANAVVSALFVGTLGPNSVFGFGLSFWSTLTAIIVGTALSALAVGYASTIGPRTGMVQILLSRFTFGYHVGRVLGFFNAIYCYAWSAVNLVTGTAAIQLAFVLMGASLLGSGRGSYNLWVIVIAAITTVISVLGYNLVHWWERFSTAASIIVFAIITAAVLLHHPTAGSAVAHGASYWKGWFGMILASFGFGISWIPYVADYSRKLPANTSSRSIFVSSFLGLTLSCVWVEGLGALLTTTAMKAVNATDVVHGVPAILGNNGLVVLGVLIIGLSTVSNNVPNDYTGGLSIQAAGIHVHRWIVTMIGGALSAVGAIFFLQNFASKFQSFLLMMSYWVGAWFVLVIYNYLRRGRKYDVDGWDNPRALPNGNAPTIAFVAALIGAWIGMYPLPDVAWNKLGQGLIGTNLGIDFGFVMAIVTALVLGVLLEHVFRDSRRNYTAANG